MKVGIGADHNAYEYKEALKEYLESKEYEIVDYGCYSKKDIDYPGIAFKVSEAVNGKEVDKAVLICGTGIGMAMAANKIKGIRAAQVSDIYSAERAALSNNAQIITFGSKVMGIEVVKKCTEEFLSLTFKGGNSARKILQIMDRENDNKEYDGRKYD